MVGHRTLAFVGNNVHRAGGLVGAVGETCASLASTAAGLCTTASGFGVAAAGHYAASASTVAAGIGGTARSLGALASGAGARLTTTAAEAARGAAAATAAASRAQLLARAIPALGWFVLGVVVVDVAVEWLRCKRRDWRGRWGGVGMGLVVAGGEGGGSQAVVAQWVDRARRFAIDQLEM